VISPHRRTTEHRWQDAQLIGDYHQGWPRAVAVWRGQGPRQQAIGDEKLVLDSSRVSMTS